MALRRICLFALPIFLLRLRSTLRVWGTTFFDDIGDEISKYQAEGNIQITGDFNAKTSTESDYVSDINDKYSPIHEIATYSCDTPIKGNNMDRHSIDAQGKRLLDLCKNSRIRLLNGRCPGDRSGNLTRIPSSYRESPSTLDYIATDP